MVDGIGPKLPSRKELEDKLTKKLITGEGDDLNKLRQQFFQVSALEGLPKNDKAARAIFEIKKKFLEKLEPLNHTSVPLMFNRFLEKLESLVLASTPLTSKEVKYAEDPENQDSPIAQIIKQHPEYEKTKADFLRSLTGLQNRVVVT